MLGRKSKPRLLQNPLSSYKSLQFTDALGGSSSAYLPLARDTAQTNFSVSTMSIHSRQLTPKASKRVKKQESLLSTPTYSSSYHKLKSQPRFRQETEEIEVKQPQTEITPFTETSMIVELGRYNYRQEQRKIIFEEVAESNQVRRCTCFRFNF